MARHETHPRYEIRVAGQLDERWLRRFEGLAMTQHPSGDSVIEGAMDQAALHSVLTLIRDLGLELISVQRRDAAENQSTTGS
jgi:hypothetical protein